MMTNKSPARCLRSKRCLLQDDISQTPTKKRKLQTSDKSSVKWLTNIDLPCSPEKIASKSFYGSQSTYINPIERKQQKEKAPIPKYAAPLAVKTQLKPSAHKKKNVKKALKRTSFCHHQKSIPKSPALKEITLNMSVRSDQKDSGVCDESEHLKTPSSEGNGQRKFFKHRCSPGEIEARRHAQVRLRKGFKVNYELSFCNTTLNGEPKSDPKADLSSTRPKYDSGILASLSKIRNFGGRRMANEGDEVVAKNTLDIDFSDSSADEEDPTCNGNDGSLTETDSVMLLSDASSVASQSDDEKEGGSSQEAKLFPIFSSKISPSSRNSKSSANSPQSEGSLKLNSTPRSFSPRVLLAKLKDKDGKEQMTLDFGQKLGQVITCPSCGMAYAETEPADVALHAKFHKTVFHALKFPGWKKERVHQENADGSRIIVVTADDKAALKKVEAVRKIVDEELGFVVENQKMAPGEQTFLYISEDKRIVGCCVAQVVKKGYRVLDENEIESSQSGAVKAWCCSTRPEPVKCGISRIWVLASERGKKIATQLVDCVRYHFILGYPLKKDELAFSDPTPDGRAFATHYTGKSSFLVYKAQSLFKH